jgi:hypothetical protein
MLYVFGLILCEIILLIFAERKGNSYLIVFILISLLASIANSNSLINIGYYSCSGESLFGTSAFLGHSIIREKFGLDRYNRNAGKIFFGIAAGSLFAYVSYLGTTLNNHFIILKQNLAVVTAVWLAFYISHLLYISIVDTCDTKHFKIQYLLASILCQAVTSLIVAIACFDLSKIFELFFTGLIVKMAFILVTFPHLISIKKKVILQTAESIV